MESAVLKMTQGRPSQSLAILLSHGVSPDAYDALLDLHFAPADADPQALTDAEQTRYNRLRHQVPTPEFEAALRTELQRRLPKLRSLTRGLTRRDAGGVTPGAYEPPTPESPFRCEDLAKAEYEGIQTRVDPPS